VGERAVLLFAARGCGVFAGCRSRRCSAAALGCGGASRSVSLVRPLRGLSGPRVSARLFSVPAPPLAPAPAGLALALWGVAPPVGGAAAARAPSLRSVAAGWPRPLRGPVSFSRRGGAAPRWRFVGAGRSGRLGRRVALGWPTRSAFVTCLRSNMLMCSFRGADSIPFR
jgi:hypothetical protein